LLKEKRGTRVKKLSYSNALKEEKPYSEKRKSQDPGEKNNPLFGFYNEREGKKDDTPSNGEKKRGRNSPTYRDRC